jgi:hypothetical protein
MRDYWQMNKECKRSGINMTRSDFTKMAKAVSAWAEENKPKHLSSVIGMLGRNAKASNVFASISKYLINDDTPTNLGNNADKLTESITALLMEIRDNADEISASIE